MIQKYGNGQIISRNAFWGEMFRTTVLRFYFSYFKFDLNDVFKGHFKVKLSFFFFNVDPYFRSREWKEQIILSLNMFLIFQCHGKGDFYSQILFGRFTMKL